MPKFGQAMSERLISVVCEYPELYNSTLPSYRNTKQKAEIWRAVDERMELKEGDCRRRWRCLRDVFIKKLRADRRRGSKGNAMRMWKFSPAMSFLIPFTRSKSNNTSNSAEEMDDLEEEEGETTSTSTVDGMPKFSQAMDERLISVVCEYPELYNYTHPSYRDTNRKEDAWRVVHERMELKEGDCRKRWRYLRDLFFRKLRVDRSCGSKGNVVGNWRHSPAMSFLIPFSHSRSNNTSNSAEEMDNLEEEEGGETTSTSDVQKDLDRSLASPTPLDSSYQEGRWRGETWGNTGQLSGDEDQMFFMSLLPHLKRLPYEKKCVIKLKFHQLLHEAEFE